MGLYLFELVNLNAKVSKVEGLGVARPGVKQERWR